MSLEKFRDMYSDYHEGVLDPALRHSFDERLERDADLREDLERFRSVYALLSEPEPPIEVPANLSARIFDRLDEQGRAPVAKAGTFWRNLGFGALAASALAGGLYAITVARSPEMMPSSVLPTSSKTEGSRLQVFLRNDKVYARLDSPTPHDVAVSSAPEGVLLRRYRLDGRILRAELVNPGSAAAAFSIRVDREPDQVVVALPGTAGPTATEQGSGDLTRFALALARRYRVPVAVRIQDEAQTLSWNLLDADVQRAAVKSVEPLKYSVDVMPGGLVSIDYH